MRLSNHAIPISAVVWLYTVCLTAIGVGQQKPDFDSIRDYLITSVENGTVAGGSVIVFHDGKIVFQTGFGYADIESKSPFELETPVIVASISKPLLGTAMFRLAQQGQLRLEAPLTDYLPEFRDAKLKDATALVRSPQVAELLTHSSGLRYDQAKNGRIWFQEWTRGKTLEDVVKKVASDFAFERQPGTKFAYSGIGTDVLARVGEVATGLSRNRILRTYLGEPLDMENTFYRDEGGLKRHGLKMPTRYRRIKVSDSESAEAKQKLDGALSVYKGRPVPPTDRYGSSGGTVISTAPDLLKWLRMIQNAKAGIDNSYLDQKTVARMLTGHEISKVAQGGLFVRGRDENGVPVYFGHTGSSGTNLWIDFETGTIGIMLTQTLGSDIKPFRIELEKKIMARIKKATLQLN